MEITTVSGPSFFIRTFYLSLVDPDELCEGTEFLEEKELELIEAGFCFACERKALEYLDRSEQYRKGLSAKLIAKGFEKQYIDRALDYLESKRYLDDGRFARIWLHNRQINHAEGRSKLSMELASRGISKENIETALDEFFEENSEEDLCRRAYKKCRKIKKDDDKIFGYLLKSGFSVKLIKKVREEYGSEE